MLDEFGVCGGTSSSGKLIMSLAIAANAPGEGAVLSLDAVLTKSVRHQFLCTKISSCSEYMYIMLSTQHTCERAVKHALASSLYKFVPIARCEDAASSGRNMSPAGLPFAGVLRAGSVPRAALAAEVQAALGSALAVAGSQVTLSAVSALPAASSATGRRLASAVVAPAPPQGPLLPNLFNVTVQLVPPYAAMPYPRLQVRAPCLREQMPQSSE